MTLNITKKKIEKVLELFNHPQTRKIRKNRGKKRRRNNKSFNRKNGRKNLATSTVKKRGGHAGHHPSVGGTVGVVLGGGPVLNNMMKNTSDKLKTFIANISKLSTEAKTQLKNAISKAGNNIKEKKEALINYIKRKKDISKDINDDEIRNIDDEQIQKIIDEIMKRLDEKEISTDQKKQEIKSKETKKEEPKSKEINSSEMLKVALASNYFTQYGILSGMLKMNQEKDNKKFDVMNFVQDPKLYAEFCNKMGFQFAKTSEKVNEVPVVEKTSVENNRDGNYIPQDNASKEEAERLKAEEEAAEEEEARLKAEKEAAEEEEARLKAEKEAAEEEAERLKAEKEAAEEEEARLKAAAELNRLD